MSVIWKKKHITLVSYHIVSDHIGFIRWICSEVSMIKSAGLVQNLGVAHGFWGNGTFRISFTKMVSPIWGQMILLSKTIQSQKRKSDPFATVDGSEIRRSPVVVLPIIYKVLCILRWLALGFLPSRVSLTFCHPSLFFVCRFSVSPLDNLVRTLRGAWVSLYPKSLQHCWYVAWQGPRMP